MIIRLFCGILQLEYFFLPLTALNRISEMISDMFNGYLHKLLVILFSTLELVYEIALNRVLWKSVWVAVH
jgi:hypothetical protein